MLTLDVPTQRTPIVSGLLGPPLPVYTSLITLHPPTQHSHCELLKRTSHTFVADLFEVTIGILYSLALKNLPKTIFRYCSLSPSFPLQGNCWKPLSLTLSAASSPFCCSRRSFPYSLQCLLPTVLTVVIFHLITPWQSGFISFFLLKAGFPSPSEFYCM